MTEEYSTSGQQPGRATRRGGLRVPPIAVAALRRLVWWLPPLAGIVVLALVIAWMSGVFHAKVQPGTIPLSGSSAAGRELVEVASLPEQETVEATGTIQPRYLINVESQILAVILEVAVHPGDRVEQGQLLLHLDDRETRTRLRDAEAALVAATAELTVRQNDYDRYRLLYADKAVTKEQYDQINGAYEVARRKSSGPRNKSRGSRLPSLIRISRPGPMAS